MIINPENLAGVNINTKVVLIETERVKSNRYNGLTVKIRANNKSDLTIKDILDSKKYVKIELLNKNEDEV